MCSAVGTLQLTWCAEVCTDFLRAGLKCGKQNSENVEILAHAVVVRGVILIFSFFESDVKSRGCSFGLCPNSSNTNHIQPQLYFVFAANKTEIIL